MRKLRKNEAEVAASYQEMNMLAGSNSQVAIFRPYETIGGRWVKGEFDVFQHARRSKVCGSD